MPDVMLVTDNDATVTLGYGQQEKQIGRQPNPYEGIITAGGPTSAEYDASANWKFCASIYKKETGKVAPNAETIIPGPNGKTLDTYGNINDACQLLTLFQEIGDRVGKNLNVTNWVHAVNTYGPIRDVRCRAVRIPAHRQVRRRRHLPPGGVRLDARAEGRLEATDTPRGRSQAVTRA